MFPGKFAIIYCDPEKTLNISQNLISKHPKSIPDFDYVEDLKMSWKGSHKPPEETT